MRSTGHSVQTRTPSHLDRYESGGSRRRSGLNSLAGQVWQDHVRQSEQALHTDTRSTNTLIRDLRALGERAAAELRERWRALKHVTLGPTRIGDIVRAALVLSGQWK
ncbi:MULTISPECIES: hypothetical protein [unclassified Streptomyces]|uniref:hypothetical protein n=1 Tax=unclassified Streptomyces TaxID=2593676 RepID=UPI00382482D1